MSLPEHKFVSRILPSHLGYPQASWWWSTSAGTTVNPAMSVAQPSFVLPRQCLEYGINHQRVEITYTAGATTAVLEWMTGAHDFEVGDWVNLRGYGGVSTTPNGYYKVTAVADSTHLTIAVPTTFTFTADSPSHVDEDLLFGYNFMLLTGNTTVTTDLLSAKNPGTWTNNGSVALTTSSAKFGTTAIDFNASTKYLKLASRGMSNNMFDVTVDMWVYPTTAGSGARTLFAWANGPIFTFDASTRTIGWYEDSAQQLVSSTTLALNTWTHVAFTRKDGVITLFVGGVKQASTWSGSESQTDDRDVYIGGNTSASTNFPGFIQNCRVSQGLQRWTANFTPPEYQPQDRPGIGYFACRGGDVIVTATDNASYPGGLLAYAATALIWVFRIASFHAAYGNAIPLIAVAAKAYAASTTPQTADFMYPLTSTGAGGEAGSFRHTLTADTLATKPVVYRAYVFSNAGFYPICWRHDQAARRYAAGYFGRCTNLNPPIGATGMVEALHSYANFMHSSWYPASSYLSNANTLVDSTSNLASSSYTAGGLLMVGVVSPTTTTSVDSFSSSADNVRAVNPFLTTATLGGTTAFLTQAYGRTNMNDNTSYQTTMDVTSMGDYMAPVCAFLARDMVLQPPASLWKAVTRIADVYHPIVAPYLSELSVDGDVKDCLVIDTPLSRGIISLDPADWEVL